MSKSLLSKIFSAPIPPVDFEEAFESVKRLRELTHNLDKMDVEFHDKFYWVQLILDTIKVPVWAKDVDNRFVYANQACCDMILHCSKDDVMESKYTDFEENALADVCSQSDEITKERGETCRFIEHSVFDDYDLWLDTTKSPWIKEGKVLGTVGTGKNITNDVPEEIRNRFRKPLLIEIPMDGCLDPAHLKKLITAAHDH